MLRFLPQNVIFSQFRRLSSSKLPERLSEKLLQGPKNRKSFPKAPKSLSLARNLAQADVSLPEFILQIQPYIANKTETTFVEDGELEGKICLSFMFYKYQSNIWFLHFQIIWLCSKIFSTTPKNT